MARTFFKMQFDVDAERDLDIDAEVLVQRHVSKKLQGFDGELFSTKWFDYRRMTPFQATLQFAQDYKQAYRYTYGREFDIQTAQYINPINLTKITADLERGDARAKRKFSALWRARQVADALTIPYDLYLRFAFEFRMRRWKRTYMPQPQHLYHEYDVEKIQERWQEQQASIFFRPKDPAFLVQNYKGIPYQDDFHEWLFKQAYMRRDPFYSLAGYIEEDFLPVEKVEARLGDDFERVERCM